jgi:hypothetical protein
VRVKARRLTRQVLLGTAACAALAPMAAASGTAAQASTRPAAHVVIVGVSGLRWSEVSPAATPVLWRLAGAGSVGALVDYAVQPVSCPADGWLTLNGGARAQAQGRCALPAVIRDGTAARIPEMPTITAYNAQFHQDTEWGLLGGLAGCATAVGPGAALALAAPSGAVSRYLPSPYAINSGVLARCPLTVVDLGSFRSPERASAAAPADTLLGRIVADLPAGTLLLVTAPGAAPAAAAAPHLQAVVVTGPGYPSGLLNSTSTRQPGIVVLTDLTPTVAGWLGRETPAGIVGAKLTRGDRGSLASAIRTLEGRDAAEQVWLGTRGWFFAAYVLADVAAFGVPALVFRGSGRRRRRAVCWRVAGTFAVAVPAGTFCANLVPWWRFGHPAWWLYGMTVAWTLAIGAAALAGPWRRDSAGPPAVVCLGTLLVLGADVMTGSRLQLEVPFGLSLVESGRFYGIGNQALGVYCVCALVSAAWLAMLTARRCQARRGYPLAIVSAVGLFAVFASGWPGFGAKVGGTIALVPCFALLLMMLAGVRLNWRRVWIAAASGLVLFAVFALVSYFFPAAGVSDMRTFAGNLLHGQGGAVLERKASSNIGSLTASVLSPLIPVAAVLAAAALWRPSALRLPALERAFAARPLLRAVVWLIWLVLVIGWFADDSGVIVPASALPFAVPLVATLVVSVSCGDGGEDYRGTAFAGSSVAGTTPR